MLNSKNVFKSYEELTEEEKRFAYDVAKFAIDYSQGVSLPTPETLSKHITAISKSLDVDPDEVPLLILKIHTMAMQRAFTKKIIEPVGFK